MHEGGKHGTGEWAHGISPFRMPLDRHDEVFVRIKFYALNYSVLRRDRADEEIVAWGPNGLMMTRVDLFFDMLTGRQEPSQPGTLSDSNRVGLDDLAARAVIH